MNERMKTMTSENHPPIAVIGASGQQGGSTIDALLAAGAPVRGLLRRPDSAVAEDLRSRGVEIVAADQEDPESLERALHGVAALFFMTTFDGPDGVAGEERRGIAVAQAAARAGVPRVVYSSVGGAERETGIPHFESKRAVERRLSELVPATFVRPAFFMENLAPQLTRDDHGDIVIRLPMPADVPLQMVAVRDIGSVSARLLIDPRSIDTHAIEIAGDELTLAHVADQVGRAYGTPARFEEVPLEALRDDEDMTAMFRWFAETPAYQADLDATRRLAPDARDLPAWLDEQRPSDAGN
jgi:uncharacterized protein YbjT (DUF2867 family)